MADTLKVHFVKSTAEDGIVDLVPTGVSTTKTILSIVICNVGETTANDANFDIYIYGVGYEDGSSGNTNIRLYNNQSLPDKSTFIHDSKIVLKPADTFKFVQKDSPVANAIHITTSYLDQTQE